jgi:hypothetical protein
MINNNEEVEFSRALMVSLVRLEAHSRKIDLSNVPDTVIEALSAQDMTVGQILAHTLPPLAPLNT